MSFGWWVGTLLLVCSILGAVSAEDHREWVSFIDHPLACADSSIWNDKATFLGYEAKVAVPRVSDEFVPYIVVGVHSPAQEVEARSAIRRTWASTNDKMNRTILVWFLLGTPQTPELVEEARYHNDILFINIDEDRRHAATPMVQMFFSVARKHFPESPWFMKTGGSGFIMFERLFEVFSSLDDPLERRSYVGYLNEHGEVIRYPGSLYFVPVLLYSPDQYPPYMAGFGYVLSNSLAQCITSHSADPNGWYMPVEDTYTGSLVAKYCPCDMVSLYQEEHQRGFSAVMEGGTRVVARGVNPTEMDLLWASSCSTRTQCSRNAHTLALEELIKYVQGSESSVREDCLTLPTRSFAWQELSIGFVVGSICSFALYRYRRVR